MTGLRWLLPATLLASIAGLGSRCGDPIPAPPGGPTGLEDALARAAARTRSLSGVRGLATVEAWEDGRRIKLQQIVVAQRPARLHIETLSPFDQPISYLATDGERLSLYLLAEQRYLTGLASADNVGRLFPLRLTPAEVVEALLGGLPPTAGDGTLRWDGERGEYEIRIGTGPAERKAWLRAEDLAPTRVEGATPGGDRWTLEVLDWDEDAGRSLPRRLRFHLDKAGTDVRFRWDEREADPEVSPDAWRIEPPEGVAVEELDGG